MKSTIFLIAACVFALSLAVPSIRYNIDDPEMITYMNLDEGELMDLCWYYYSGEKRASFLWEEDYGLEMPYLMDLCRLVPKHIHEFTPGELVLLIRVIHLAGWILALIALWSLVGRHFGKGWKQAVAVALLAVRPAFGYLLNNMKPEPLVLFFMIAGLDYALRIIDDPRRKNIIIAVLFSSVAFLVKYAGIFVLPAVVAAVYMSAKRYKNRFAWSLPAIAGAAVIAFALYIIFFYTRKATGSSWYADEGLAGSLFHNRYAAFSVACGIVMMAVSAVLLVLERSKNPKIARVSAAINGVNSTAMVVIGIFTAISAVLGIKWLLQPKLFMLSHSWLAPTFINTDPDIIPRQGFICSYAAGVFGRFIQLDIIVFAAFVFYAIVEISGLRSGQAGEEDGAGRKKRTVLCVFLAPFFAMALLPLNLRQHHMLPFFTVMSVLSIEGVSMAVKHWAGVPGRLRVIIGAFVLLLSVDIALSGSSLVWNRVYYFGLKNDAAFEVRDWMEANISDDTGIASDHYIRSYIPGRLKNVNTFYSGYFDKDPAAELTKILVTEKPEFIYYNEGTGIGDALPPLGEMVPGIKAETVRVFDSSGRRHIRSKGDRFVVYRVIYLQGMNK
ncbi:MAG: glycosyltransferase family 39 protein [Candidatus Omnitrophica bacterium]|nr:glycosyltransferase family 39 protein [Candidatus Omnitrophota bacterium]MDD5736861.1 glycosyltransferase family 39 protein [Candidatus Omnitrophota bacterium]